MHIELTAEQAMLQEITRNFLAKESPVSAVRSLVDDPIGFDPALWRRGADLGWHAMLVSAQHGGTGSDELVRDTAIIAEELGRFVQPGPLLPSLLVAFAVSEFGTDAQREQVLPGLISGEHTAAWCLAEGDQGWDPHRFAATVVAVDGGYELSGVKDLVQNVENARHLLVTARAADGPVQFLVAADTSGVDIEPLNALDLTRRFSRVRFDDVHIPAAAVLGAVPGAGGAQWRRLFDLAVVLHCAETVGVMERIFELALEYAGDRFAFGRAIGSFQAIKHMCADMFGWLESAKAITAAAVDAVDGQRPDAAELASTAKAYVSEQAPQLVQHCLQIFGGIGYTWEHDLHFYLRRAKSNEVLYGSPEWHRERICELLGLTAKGGLDG